MLTDETRHEEANSGSTQFCEKTYEVSTRKCHSLCNLTWGKQLDVLLYQSYCFRDRIHAWRSTTPQERLYDFTINKILSYIVFSSSSLRMVVLGLHRSHEKELGEAAGRSLRHSTTLKTCRSQIRCLRKLYIKLPVRQSVFCYWLLIFAWYIATKAHKYYDYYDKRNKYL
jgi:hypothetical protein